MTSLCSMNFPKFSEFSLKLLQPPVWYHQNRKGQTFKIYIFISGKLRKISPIFSYNQTKPLIFTTTTNIHQKFYFLHSSKFLIQIEISWTIQVEVLIHRSNNKVKKFVFWFFKIAGEGWIWFKTSNSCQI